MKILFLATRSPWPPADGGRLLMALTIEGLLARGHEVTVVAPARPAPAGESDRPSGPEHPRLAVHGIPVSARSRVRSFLESWGRREPVSSAAQRWLPVAAAVARLVAERRFDVVHVEQPQALSHADAAQARGVPLVLRAENVESDLWRQLAGVRRLWRPFVAFEARRVSRWEAQALEAANVVVPISAEDGRMIARLAPGASIRVVAAPMPATLPANAVPLAGAPAVVSFASAWFPNRDGVEWFVRDVWPRVSVAVPEARLHLFGRMRTRSAGSIEVHAPPAESREAFVSGSIMAVPLRMASGTRLRILEAWARGVPVVATSAAVTGLDEAGRAAVRIADTPEEFAAAFADLASHPGQVRNLIERGRAVLAAHHDPAACAAALEQVYGSVVEASRPGPSATS